MLKGTIRQGIWHVLMGLAVPNKSLLPRWAMKLQANEMCSPAFPASVVDKTSIWEYWDFIAWGTEKCTGILWGAGIQTKQTSFSLREPTAHTQVSDSHPSPQDTPTPQLP